MHQETVAEASEKSPRHPPPFFFALLLGVVWLVILGLLSLWTANPVTVNRAQLIHSDVVVAGQFLGEPGQIEIDSVLTSRFPGALSEGNVLTVTPVASHWEEGETRIVPLIRDAEGDWQVTKAPLPKTPYLDYPDTQDVRSQIAEILKRVESDNRSTDR